jgi:hypothetical protein
MCCLLLAKYMSTIQQFGGWALFQELLTVLKQIADKYKVDIANVSWYVCV